MLLHRLWQHFLPIVTLVIFFLPFRAFCLDGSDAVCSIVDLHGSGDRYFFHILIGKTCKGSGFLCGIRDLIRVLANSNDVSLFQTLCCIGSARVGRLIVCRLIRSRSWCWIRSFRFWFWFRIWFWFWIWNRVRCDLFCKFRSERYLFAVCFISSGDTKV